MTRLRTLQNTFVHRAVRRQRISDFVSPLSAASPKESKKHHLNAVTSKLSAPEPQKGFRTHDPPLQTSIFAKTLNIYHRFVSCSYYYGDTRDQMEHIGKYIIPNICIV